MVIAATGIIPSLPGEFDKKGALDMVLWGMSLMAAGIILIATGFARVELVEQKISPGRAVIYGAIIWVLGWMATISGPHHMRINLGFIALALTGLIALAQLGRGRWIAAAGVLAAVGGMVRYIAPFHVDQTSFLPQAIIQSLGLGGAAGFSALRPWPAAVVAASAESLSCLAVAFMHQNALNLGRHDLAAVIFAVLGGWCIGWVASGIGQKFGRSIA